MHAKVDDRTGQPVVYRLWVKPHTNDFHEFVFDVLYFVAVGSFTADGGLLQPTGCKDNTSKDPFSHCEQLQGIRVQVKSEFVGTLMATELMTQSRTTSTTTCFMWPQI